MHGIPFSLVRDALVGKAELAVLNNDNAGAIAIYRDLLLRPVQATMHGTEYACRPGSHRGHRAADRGWPRTPT